MAVSNEQTISLRFAKVAAKHDAREYTPDNADAALEGRNVYIRIAHSVENEVNAIFKDAVDEYNSKQKRADRKKSYDVYGDALKAAKQTKGKNDMKPVYEFVLAAGDHETAGVCDAEFDPDEWEQMREHDPEAAAAYVQEHLNKDPRREDLKAALIETCKALPEKYPHLEFIGIYIHDDEPCGTCHAHVQFVPKGTGYKQGLKMRPSLTKALGNMGFKTGKTTDYDYRTAQQQWQDDAKDFLEEKMNEYGFTRVHKGIKGPGEDIHGYKARQRRKKAEAKAAEAQAQADEAFAAVAQAQEMVDIYTEYAEAQREEIEARKEDVEAKEQAAIEREQEIATRETQAAQAEAQAQAKLDEASAKEEAAQAKETAAQEAIDSIDAREEAVSAKASELAAEFTEHAEKVTAELNEREDSLDVREEAIAGAEERIKAKYQEREAAIAAREQAVKDAEEMLERRRKKIDKDEEEAKSLTDRLKESLSKTDELARALERALLNDAHMRLIVEGIRKMFAALRSTPAPMPGLPDAKLDAQVHMAMMSYDERMEKRNGKPIPESEKAAKAFYDLSDVADAAKEAKQKAVHDEQREQARRDLIDAEKYLRREDGPQLG